jgi:outer membrane protein assembly factor BamB
MSSSNDQHLRSLGPVTRRRFIVASGALLAAAGLAPRLGSSAQDATPAASPTAPLPTMPPEITEYANDWPTPQGNLKNQRAASNSSIDSSSVTSLDVAWTFPIKATSGYGGMTCTPIIAGDTVYVQDMLSNVFAIKRDTGELVWEADYNSSCEGPNGVALGYGMIYGSTGDAREVFALDAATGKEVWKTLLSGNTREGIDMAPNVYGGMVLISTVPGNSQAFYDGGARGTLFGLDAATGEILWQFATVDENLWGNPSINSGGGSWYPPAIDDDGNLYWDIANPAPFQPVEVDGTPITLGSTFDDALYTDCLVSLEPDGTLRWYYAANPHDIFDHDLQQSPVLATIDNNGSPYTVALSSGKLGKVIAVETTTGHMIWTAKVGEHTQWDDAQWIPPGQSVTVAPGVAGGVESPIAYADGTVYVPILNLPVTFNDKGLDASTLSFNDATGELTALDVMDGSVKWDVKLPAGNVSAATVSNDVVFAGALDGIVRAYSTNDGTLLWSYDTGVGLNAPFAVAGDLLVVPAAGAKLVSKSYAPEATPVATSDAGAALIGFKVSS